ncbi:MAG: hypothetical protein O7D32_11740 [bacterium]|nr:hypothetical protein [bacterium]
MLKQEEDKKHLLRKDKEYVKFTQLLRRAEREGRLDGTFTCNLCGMKYHSIEEASGCCKVPVT